MKGKILHVLMVLYYILLPVYILNILKTYGIKEPVDLDSMTFRIIFALIITGIVVVVSYVLPNAKRASLKGELQENFERKTIDRQLTYCLVGQLAGVILILPAVLSIMKLNGHIVSPYFEELVNPIINTVNSLEIYSKQVFIAILIVGYMIFVTIPGMTASLNLYSVGQFTIPKTILSMIIMFIPSIGMYYNIGLKIDVKKRTRREIKILGKIIYSIIISIIVIGIIYFIVKYIR